MRKISGEIISINGYLAGQLSEHVDYSRMNSSKCALLTVQTSGDLVTIDMLLQQGANPQIGNTVNAELDDQGNFGLLYPEDLK